MALPPSLVVSSLGLKIFPQVGSACKGFLLYTKVAVGCATPSRPRVPWRMRLPRILGTPGAWFLSPKVKSQKCQCRRSVSALPSCDTNALALLSCQTNALALLSCQQNLMRSNEKQSKASQQQCQNTLFPIAMQSDAKQCKAMQSTAKQCKAV